MYTKSHKTDRFPAMVQTSEKHAGALVSSHLPRQIALIVLSDLDLPIEKGGEDVSGKYKNNVSQILVCLIKCEVSVHATSRQNGFTANVS